MIGTRLTMLEFDVAQHVACQRNRDGILADADAEKFGNNENTLAVHLPGCLGELAFAKATGQYWSGAGTSYHDDADVGAFQVRTTTHANGHLIVRPGEGHEDAPWALVTGEFPVYTVVGWIWGRDARRQEWLRTPNDRPPAFFVPRGSLNDWAPR